jgi:hypothetical protein
MLVSSPDVPKNNWNRLAGAAPLEGWNITPKNPLTIRLPLHT